METAGQLIGQSAFGSASELRLERSSSKASPLGRSLGLVTLAWMFGSIWWNTTTGTPLTVFAKGLGASNFQFGLLTALPFVASLLSAPGSLLIEWTGWRKRIFLSGFYVQRAMWLAIALIPLWILARYGTAAAGPALWTFLVLMFLMYGSGAIGGPAWLSWMADLVPLRLNGRYFSRRRQWGILTAVPAAVFVGWFLDRCAGTNGLSKTQWCAVLFLGCAVCGLADIHLFQYVPEISAAPRRDVHPLKAMRLPLRNRRFMCYSGLAGSLTFAVNLLGQFATLYLIEQVGISNMGVQMILVVTPMLAQLLVLGVWGRAADRMGKKPLLILASIGLVPVGLGWCLVTPGSVWLAYLLTGLGAALWTGIEVANLNLVLETSGCATSKEQGCSSYAAINSVIINLGGGLGGLAAGLIAELLGNWHWQPLPALKSATFYDILFIASGVLRLASLLIFLPLLHEPTARSTRQTFRFMTSGLAALLITTSSQPLRMLGLARHRKAALN